MSSIDLVVEDRGSGPPLVLVPTALGNRAQWEHVAADLATDHRVIVYEPRGFGDSPEPAEDFFDWQDALGVLDHVGEERAVFVGGSNGGRICADTAVMAPEAVAGLVLLAPALPGIEWDAWPEMAAQSEELDRLLEAGDVEAAAAIDFDVWMVGVGRDRGALDRALVDRVWPWFVAASERERTQFQDAEWLEIDPPLRERLGDIAAPTLVVIGEHDQPRMQVAARTYADGVPDARLIDLPGVAHLPAVEAPQETVRLVRHFLADLGW